MPSAAPCSAIAFQARALDSASTSSGKTGVDGVNVILGNDRVIGVGNVVIRQRRDFVDVETYPRGVTNDRFDVERRLQRVRRLVSGECAAVHRDSRCAVPVRAILKYCRKVVKSVSSKSASIRTPETCHSHHSGANQRYGRLASRRRSQMRLARTQRMCFLG